MLGDFPPAVLCDDYVLSIEHIDSGKIRYIISSKKASVSYNVEFDASKGGTRLADMVMILDLLSEKLRMQSTGRSLADRHCEMLKAQWNAERELSDLKAQMNASA